MPCQAAFGVARMKPRYFGSSPLAVMNTRNARNRKPKMTLLWFICSSRSSSPKDSKVFLWMLADASTRIARAILVGLRSHANPRYKIVARRGPHDKARLGRRAAVVARREPRVRRRRHV